MHATPPLIPSSPRADAARDGAARLVVLWQLERVGLDKRPAALVRDVVDDKHGARKLELAVVAVVRLRDLFGIVCLLL